MIVKTCSRVISLLLVIIMVLSMIPFGAVNMSAYATLSGSTNAEKIWNYFKRKGFSERGIAGLMGNIKKESNFYPNNLQDSYESALGYTDSSYTAAVDNGSYSKNSFMYDSAGYGLCQWTYWSRKRDMYESVKGKGVSIADLEAQLDFCYYELNN